MAEGLLGQKSGQWELTVSEMYAEASVGEEGVIKEKNRGKDEREHEWKEEKIFPYF